jgi:hypothetical protein
VVAELVALQAEYAGWLEASRDSAVGEALQRMVDLVLDEVTAIAPPEGYERDQAGPMTRTMNRPCRRDRQSERPVAFSVTRQLGRPAVTR